MSRFVLIFALVFYFSAFADEGFKVSEEAFKNFEITLLKLSGGGPWPLKKSAVVYSGEEVNLYRVRGGLFKRIDFETVQKSGVTLTVKSADLQAGDEVVLTGLGFLRIAELAAYGGVADSHSH